MRGLILLLVLLVKAKDAFPQNNRLNRRAFLGIQFQPSTSSGLEVINVFENSTASKNDIRVDDVLLSVNGETLHTNENLLNSLKLFRSTDTIAIEYRRGKNRFKKDVILKEFPVEVYHNASLRYESVNSESGIQRTILTLPVKTKIEEAPPVVYILPGFGCNSLEQSSSDGTLFKLIQHLTNKGFATFRVEKTGVGDSIGTPCEKIGFNEETMSFKIGMQSLIKNDAVDGKNVYLLGLSLGSTWAPIIATAFTEHVSGIITFGAIVKTWEEYMYDNWRRQWELAGRDYTEIERDLKLSSLFWHGLSRKMQSPETLFDEQPELKRLKVHLGITSKETQLFGRHHSFVKELSDVPISKYWEKVKAPTLILFGNGDYVASEDDQKLLYRLLSARQTPVILKYVNSDHWWNISTSHQESYRNRRNGILPGIQTDIIANITSWLEERAQQNTDK